MLVCCWYCQIADLANEDTPQMYTLCGRGPRSSLRVLRHGLEVINSRDQWLFTNFPVSIFSVLSMVFPNHCSSIAV